MPLWRGKRYALRPPTPNKYLLDDEFHSTLAAGAVNNTLATPGPGTRDAVTDTNSKLSIGSGVASHATGGVAMGDPGMWYESLTRTAGRMWIVEVTTSAGSNMRIGWDNNQATGVLNVAGITTTVLFGPKAEDGSTVAVGTVTASTSYVFALIQRAAGMYFLAKGGTEYPTWTLLTAHTKGSTATLFPAVVSATNASVFTSSFRRIPAQTFIPKPLAFDSFSRANGALGSSESSGPDGQASPVRVWTGATWAIVGNVAQNTPGLGGESLNNPGFEGVYDDESGGGGGTVNVAPSWNAFNVETDGTDTLDEELVIVHGGSKSQYVDVDATDEGIIQTGAFSVGDWNRAIAWVHVVSGAVRMVSGNGLIAQTSKTTGSFEQLVATGRPTSGGIFLLSSGAAAEFYVDDASAKAITLADLFATTETNTKNVLVDVKVKTDPDGTQVGVVVRLDSAVTPANYVVGYLDGAGNLKMDKVVAGTATNLVDEVAAYSADAVVRVIPDGDEVTMYYDDALIGTPQTVNDAGIVDNTLHGMFSTASTPTLDDATIFSRGNDGAYDDLNRWSGVNP